MHAALDVNDNTRSYEYHSECWCVISYTRLLYDRRSNYLQISPPYTFARIRLYNYTVTRIHTFAIYMLGSTTIVLNCKMICYVKVKRIRCPGKGIREPWFPLLFFLFHVGMSLFMILDHLELRQIRWSIDRMNSDEDSKEGSVTTNDSPKRIRTRTRLLNKFTRESGITWLNFSFSSCSIQLFLFLCLYHSRA